MKCPLRIADDAKQKNCCCRWDTFAEGFTEYWPRWFDRPPELKDWQAARLDWRAGNSGYEAAHNAQSRAKDKAAKDAAPPLVWLGGRNYAAAGSELAIKYGRPKPATPSGGA